MQPEPNLISSGIVTMVTRDSNGNRREEVDFGPRHRGFVEQTSQNGNFIDPNNYYCRTLDFTYPQGRSFFREGWPSGQWVTRERVGCITVGDPSNQVIFPDDSALYERALSRLNASTRGELDATLALAQAGQTASMLNASRKARDYALANTPKVQKAGWRDHNGRISQAWLEFTYGWSPLASDLYAAATQASNVALNTTSTFQESAASRGVIGEIRFSSYDGGHVLAPCRGRLLRACKLGIVLDTDDFGYAQWGSMNPASLTWETLPYSFVVDWFYDVASYVRGVETALLLGKSFRSGFVTQSCKAQGDYKISTSSSEGYWPNVVRELEASGRFKFTSHSRTSLSSYPVPYLPKFKVELGWQRLVSAAALLAQRISKRLP